MSTTTSTANWYADPYRRYEQRYHDGTRWTSYVASGGVQSTDVEPLPRAQAAPVAPAGAPRNTVTSIGTGAAAAGASAKASYAVALPEAKRRTLSFVAQGCGAAMVLAVFLPWGTSSAGSINGVDAKLGFLTGLCGGLFGLWGRQGLLPDPVRYKGGALTALIVAFMTSTMTFSILDDLDTVTLGVGNVQPGFGLYLTILASMVGVWPLTGFWRDFIQRKQAARPALVSR